MQSFQVLLRVRYCECDPQGVVFNARYGDYADIAVSEFYRHMFGGPDGMLERNLDTQVVRLLTEWQSPARFDDVLAIAVRVKHIGNTSFSLSFDICQYPSKRGVARTEITYVMVTADKFAKQAIPVDYRAWLQSPIGGMVDLAGVGLSV